jgi:hypothetical protein
VAEPGPEWSWEPGHQVESLVYCRQSKAKGLSLASLPRSSPPYKPGYGDPFLSMQL